MSKHGHTNLALEMRFACTCVYVCECGTEKINVASEIVFCMCVNVASKP